MGITWLRARRFLLTFTLLRRGARGKPDPDGLTKIVVIYAYHCKVNSTREIENLRFLFDHGDMSAVTMILVSVFPANTSTIWTCVIKTSCRRRRREWRRSLSTPPRIIRQT